MERRVTASVSVVMPLTLLAALNTPTLTTKVGSAERRARVAVNADMSGPRRCSSSPTSSSPCSLSRMGSVRLWWW